MDDNKARTKAQRGKSAGIRNGANRRGIRSIKRTAEKAERLAIVLRLVKVLRRNVPDDMRCVKEDVSHVSA